MEPTVTNDQIGTRDPIVEVEPEEMLPVIREHIVRTQDTCWGKPRIAGTRIKVKQVVIWHEQMGMSAGEIISKWSHLKLADVYAALTYYHEHRDEIGQQAATGPPGVPDGYPGNPGDRAAPIPISVEVARFDRGAEPGGEHQEE